MHRYTTMRFEIPSVDDESTWRSIGWTPNMVDKHHWPIRWMKPGKYLALVDRSFGPGSPNYQQSTIDWMHDEVRKGHTFAPLQVKLEKPVFARVLPHEGRHRAWVARELGRKCRSTFEMTNETLSHSENKVGSVTFERFLGNRSGIRAVYSSELANVGSGTSVTCTYLLRPDRKLV